MEEEARLDAEDVSIRASREGGDRRWSLVWRCKEVSIRASREGGDATTSISSRRTRCFNPRLP